MPCLTNLGVHILQPSYNDEIHLCKVGNAPLVYLRGIQCKKSVHRAWTRNNTPYMISYGILSFIHMLNTCFWNRIPLIYKYTYRIGYRAEENQSDESIEVRWKCTGRATYYDYDEPHNVDPFTSKFVRDHIPEAIPQHPANTKHHHGQLREETPITYKIPLAMRMKRNA